MAATPNKSSTDSTASPFAFGQSSSGSNPNPFANFAASSVFGSSSSTPSFSFNASTFGSLVNNPSEKKEDKKEDEDDEDDGEDDDGGAAADESHAADFKPLVELAPVDVKSMEEDEDVIFKSRAKLYIFVKEDTYGDEVRRNWYRERGLGEVKILKHRTRGIYRLLMRQEKTLKLCMNHNISPQCILKPTAGSEGKSWNFVAIDFADGEPKQDLFALKLPSPEVADQFKKHFEEAQRANSDVKPSSTSASTTDKQVSVQSTTPATSTQQKPQPVAKEAPSPSKVETVAKEISEMKVTEKPLAGGYSKRNPDEADVKKAAKFAVEKISQGELVKIASVKSQVVAGMNYRMALHIKNAAGNVMAHVVTVFQPLPHTNQPLSVTDHVVTGKVA